MVGQPLCGSEPPLGFLQKALDQALNGEVPVTFRKGLKKEVPKLEVYVKVDCRSRRRRSDPPPVGQSSERTAHQGHINRHGRTLRRDVGRECL